MNIQISQIQQLLDTRSPALQKAGITVSLRRNIPYGAQFDLKGPAGSGLLNVYFSKKKGISIVDCSKNIISGSAEAILAGRHQEELAPDTSAGSGNAKEHQLGCWVGTDESGKGDFFGPLVVAGFLVDRETVKKLIAMGVTDSKKLDSPRIRSIAAQLKRAYPERIAIVAPSVRRYNEMYASIGNLNRLLAWGHARVIANLHESWEERGGCPVDGVVSDKFGDDRYILNALKSMRTINLIQRHRGESNPAVAAASILARDRFEHEMEKLSRRFSVKLPFGAGSNVITAGRRFVEKHGREKLAEVAKTHFKTVQKL
jgi:ribonuclease HIII